MLKTLSILSCSLLFPFVCSASFEITEVMYNPVGTDTKQEWIEVRNSGESPVDISDYFVQMNGLTSTYHSFTPEYGGMVGPGEYAVIVQDIQTFRTAYPAVTATVIDSTWSDLTNTTGKVIVLNNGQKEPLSQYQYDPTIGGANTGTSLQKSASGVWIEALPTPGSATVATVSTPINDDDSGEDGSQTGEQTVVGSDGAVQANTASTTIPIPKPVVKNPQPGKLSITTPRLVFAGVETPIQLSVIGHFGESVLGGEYRVAFGDGRSVKISSAETISHTYMYSGTYTVVAYYRKNRYSQYPDAHVKTTIEVIDPLVSMTTHTDGSVSLKNSETRDVNISYWNISDALGLHLYQIPEGTFIAGGKTIRIPASVLGYSVSEVGDIYLRLPSGAVTAQVTPSVQSISSVPTLVLSDSETATPLAQASVSGNTLEKISSSGGKNTESLIPYIMSFVVVVGAGLYVIYAMDKEQERLQALRNLRM